MALAIPTLTVTDNQDGTATFTISGGDAAASNLIRYSKIELPGWMDIATVTGNTSTTVSVQLGLKWFAVFSTKASETVVSPPTPAIITPSPTAVWEQCIQSVVTTIQGAAALSEFSSDITADNVVRQDVIDLEALASTLPAIVVTPGLNETQEDKASTDKSDGISYPIMVAVMDRKDAQETANTPTYLYWREVVRQLFNRKRLPGVPTSWATDVNFEIALDHKREDGEEGEMNEFATSLRLECKTWERRWT